MVMSSSPGQEDPALPEDTAISDSVEALCFELPGSRASPADFATAVTSALVVSFPPGSDDPASPQDTATSDSVKTLYSAISRGRPSPTGFPTSVAAELAVSFAPGPENLASPLRLGFLGMGANRIGFGLPCLPLGCCLGLCSTLESAILEGWQLKVGTQLAERQVFWGAQFLDLRESLQLLNSSHLRERYKIHFCGRFGMASC